MARPLSILPLQDRLWDKVVKTEDCWLWQGGKNHKGYGYISVDGKMKSVHRVSYELLVGKIPDGLQLDHLCKIRNCVKPEHLDPVTLQENIKRGDTGKYQRR